jgi:hypothetical protein
VSISKERAYGGVDLRENQTADVTVTPHTNAVQLIEADGDLDVTLPDARLLTLGGVLYVVCNIGSGGHTITVKDGSGSTIGTLDDDDTYKLSLAANGTQAGEWIFDLRTVGSAGAGNPAYAGVGGNNDDDGTIMLYEHVTESFTNSAVPNFQGAINNLEGYGMVLLSSNNHKIASTVNNHDHWQYAFDSFITKSRFTPGSSKSTDPRGTGVVAAKIIHVYDGEDDIFEWDVTDTWTELSALAISNILRECRSEVSPDGSSLFCQEVGANPSFPSTQNAFYAYVRDTQTGVEAQRNPYADEQELGETFLADDDRMHIVGGLQDVSQTDATNAHFSYDLSLGVNGSWIQEQPHAKDPVEVWSPGASQHGTISGRVTLMGGQPNTGTASTRNDDCWYFDQPVQTWTFKGDMLDFRRDCAELGAQVTYV